MFTTGSNQARPVSQQGRRVKALSLCAGGAVQALIQDIRYAFRSLRKAPGFTFVAVLTLGLGIGANTTMFSVVNGVLLKPLPYEQPDRLVNIWVDLGVGNQSLPAVHPGDFRDYQQRSTLFEDFAAASGGTFRTGAGILTGDGKPEQVDVSVVTANFFPLLGVKPALGKYFDEEDELIGGAEVAVISHRLWSRRFGSDPSIVGSTVTMDGVGTTIVGVLPPEFRMHLPSEAFLFRDSEMYKPLRMNWDNLPPRNFTSFTVFGRLKTGVTIEQAQDEMSRIQRELRAEYPVHEASDMRIRVIPLQDDIVKHSRRGLMILLGAVGFVLLIACANVGHLILARGMSREREFALRASVGATPGRVVRQLLTESVALATLGGVLGVGLTMWGIALLRLLGPGFRRRGGARYGDPVRPLSRDPSLEAPSVRQLARGRQDDRITWATAPAEFSDRRRSGPVPGAPHRDRSHDAQLPGAAGGPARVRA